MSSAGFIIDMIKRDEANRRMRRSRRARMIERRADAVNRAHRGKIHISRLKSCSDKGKYGLRKEIRRAVWLREAKTYLFAGLITMVFVILVIIFFSWHPLS